MDTVTIDGKDETDFRYAVEDMLRLDEVDGAVAHLRGLLEPFAGHGRALPPRFLTVTAADIEFTGWERLAQRLAGHDRPGFPISAIGVVLADARVLGGPGPKDGLLTPFLKTYYFTDDAYPFTESSRDDLLDGYSREGFGWQGDYQATDATLGIRGLDDLHGAIIALEDRLLDAARPDPEQIRAGTIGACYVAALIHQALRDTIRARGLPRPLCVLAACDGVYPFFDAPVAGWEDWQPAPGEEPVPLALGSLAEEEAEAGIAEGSLLDIFSRKGTKTLALALGEDDLLEVARYAEEAGAQRLVVEDESRLRGLLHGMPAVALDLLEPPPAEPEWPVETQAPVPPASLVGADAGSGHDEFARDLAAEDPAGVPEPFDLWPAQGGKAKDAAFPSGRDLRQRFTVAPEENTGLSAAAVRRAAMRAARRTRRRLTVLAGRLRARLRRKQDYPISAR